LSTDTPNQSDSARADIFATTHWTVVLTAGRNNDPQARAALEELCRTYWFPIYAYIRRRGRTREDAEDLAQEFFRRLIEKNDFAKVDSEKGRFRAFLLAMLKHFLANEWDKSQRQKRGGGVPHISLDWQSADTQFQLSGGSDPSPDRAFDREWAVALLGKVIERLGSEYAAEGKGPRFESLKPFLATGQSPPTCAEAARELGIEETALRVAVHRLRKRYRQLLRAEIAGTLANAEQVEEELRALFGAFGK
jgi:RNA polymerase sigma factor (sigma-70 family)